jgi:Peptidase family M23
MEAGGDTYSKIISDPFDGTIMPIAYVPDWTKPANQDKSKRFEDISISEYLPIPLYDALSLADSTSSSKAATILRYTYTVLYMGSYTLNYKEHDGSHLGVDIRAPIGTPVLSIANWVVVRVTEWDATGNKYVVIRHDNVSWNGTNTTLYSAYLHLSEILITEWNKIRKWEMLGRVGMTGIATTPHLHLQIDTADAPFHPYWWFTTSESRAAGLGFFESVNAGLGKENSLKYTIHPMSFINTYLGWVQWETYTSAPSTPLTTPWSNITPSETVIASYISSSAEECSKKRYSDVSEKSALGRMLYPMIDGKCLFQEYDKKFSSKSTVTKKEAIIALMKYYDIKPVNGTSHFLDVTIGDRFQWYALAAYRQGILDGNYAGSEQILTKWEFINLVVKIAQAPRNPSQIRIYNDVDTLNPYYQSAQDYAYMTRARGGKFSPNMLLTRSMMVQILSGLKEKK